MIFDIRICFVLRAWDFEFGFELAPCALRYAFKTTDYGQLTTDSKNREEMR
jgi:hypothetical protein